MSKFRVIFNATAEKEFAKLDKAIQSRVFKAIAKLPDNPRPPGCKKLTGSPNWRIRIGDFRVVYDIVAATMLINIVKIGHRKEVYD